MSMKFNGTELSDVYFNGTQLDKVYFNGVLIFEKVQGYKRRIKPGDNLKGQTIYFEAWDGFGEMMANSSRIDFYDENTMIVLNTNSTISFEEENSIFADESIWGEMDWDTGEPLTYVYKLYPTNDYTSPLYQAKINSTTKAIISEMSKTTSFTIPNDKNYFVSSTGHWAYYHDEYQGNNPAHRCLYIKDPNVRPLQPGDILECGTQLYFDIPDNAYETNGGVLPLQINCSYEGSGGSSGTCAFITPSHPLTMLCGGVPSTLGNEHATCTLYQWNTSKRRADTNMSSLAIDRSNITYTILEDEFVNGEANRPYIYVDVTTLGNVEYVDYGYTRRLRSGDTLLTGTTLYHTFPQGFHNQITNNINFVNFRYRNPGETSWNNSDTMVQKIASGYKYVMGSTKGLTWEATEGMYSYNTSTGEEYISDNDSTCFDFYIQSYTDCPAYRYITVAQPGIRPLRVGDYINKSTRFYNITPDHYLGTSPGDSVFEIGNNMLIDWGDSIISTVGGYGDTLIFESIDGNYTNNTNLSAFYFNNLFGEVSRIDSTLESYNYILVDETTLGNQYIRTPQVGNFVMNTDFYISYTLDDIIARKAEMKNQGISNNIFFKTSAGAVFGEFYDSATDTFTVAVRANETTTNNQLLLFSNTPGDGYYKVVQLFPGEGETVIQDIYDMDYLDKHVKMDYRDNFPKRSHGGGSN